MADNPISQYDQDFADAMALKLRLNRKKSLVTPSADQPFRASILEQTAKRHPGLTPEDLDLAAEEMRKMGF